MNQENNNKTEKPRGFFAKWIDKLDKKMKEKSKSSCCCSSKKDKEDDSCCS